MKKAPKKTFRTVRAIVEVPVAGDFSEKDLVWLVRSLIESRSWERDPRASGCAFGVPRVLQYEKHIRAHRVEVAHA